MTRTVQYVLWYRFSFMVQYMCTCTNYQLCVPYTCCDFLLNIQRAILIHKLQPVWLGTFYADYQNAISWLLHC